nr:hypothetical protein [Bacteroidota bacterium]
MRRLFPLLSALLFMSSSFAQSTFPINGVKNTFEPIHAFVNAHIVLAPGEELPKATLLIQGGRIISADTTTAIPSGAIVHDLEGDYIYPSFIELHS